MTQENEVTHSTTNTAAREFTEFTYAEAIAIAQRNMQENCPSVSRVFLARIAELEAALLAKSAAYDALVAERDMLKEDLAFVERWANHHAMKPHVTPAQALGVIQHYPAITDITKAYADGVVPNTRNPWAELAQVTKERDALCQVCCGAKPGHHYSSCNRLLVSDDRPSHTAGENDA